jgi:hypothetical protein
MYDPEDCRHAYVVVLDDMEVGLEWWFRCSSCRLTLTEIDWVCVPGFRSFRGVDYSADPQLPAGAGTATT